MSTRIPGATLERPEAAPSRHRVVAAFPSIESARMAADALAAIPIPADKIALSPAEEGLAGQLAAPYNFDERREVSSSVASGAVLGALVGGVGALVLAGLIAAVFNADLSAVILLSVMVFGAVGVGALGGFMSGSTLDHPVDSGPSPAWPRLSVECEGEEETEEAIQTMQQRGALELYRDEEQLA
jgi:uncharacterized protein (DUF697 family)